MFSNKKKIILVFVTSIVMYFIYNSISPFLKENLLGRSKKISVCDKSSWIVLKKKIISDTANDDELYALYGLADKCRFSYRLRSNDIKKILESFEKSNNIYTKRAILIFLSKVADKDLIRENPQAKALLKSVAMERENSLSVISMGILLNQFKPSFDELVDTFQSVKNQKIKIMIISHIYDYSTPARELDKVKIFLQSLVESKDKKIASKSFALLTGMEGADKWQSWQWSEWVNKKILQASEGDFYLLSELDPLAMLEITRKYPNSKFTKSCIEFRSPFPGDTYFKGGSTNGFRRPFFYEKELSMYDSFTRKYPGHPALNDIVYRKARAYEFKGQYDKSIIYYYDSLRFGDADEFSYYTLPRIFFITNFLMDHKSVEKFITNHKKHPLIPYLSYTQVIHSMKENKIDIAKSEIESFIAKYQTDNTLLKQYTSLSPDFQYTSVEKEFYDTYFWSEVKKQHEFIKKLSLLRNKPTSDYGLYEEAKLWISYEFPTYNLLVLGDGISGANSFRSDEWDSKSGDEYLISYDNYQKAKNHDKWRNKSQRSIDALEKLLKDYPQSPIAEKAKYSIGLIYYLAHEEKLGIKTFKEFVKQFPNSSMADDALISIADMTQADDPERLKTLQELISKYPFGDRRKDANKMIADPYSRSGGYQGGTATSNVLLGVNLSDISEGKVSITEVSSNSFASKNSIKVGDFIHKIMGETIKSSDDVVSKIKRYQPGDIIRVQIIREDKPITFEIDTSK